MHTIPQPRGRTSLPALSPLAALLSGLGTVCAALAQPAGEAGAPAAPATDVVLPAVRATAAPENASGKESLRASTSSIGKGQQPLRDIPQSVTVVTERLIDDRNLDTRKDALKNASG